VLATAALVGMRLAGVGDDPVGLIDLDQPAPAIVGTTLDGAPFDLASLRGRPVIVNFWGPTCEPCRDEFPLFKAKLAEHEADGLTIVGVRMYDSVPQSLEFMAQFGATWATVDDPDGAIRRAYRVLARPQTYFIDADGILRAIQVGEVTADRFEFQYATIRPGSGVRGSGAPGS
jgi:cytochrome c biogenesis protein CcmG/thiol:disulfide interchange protein DsbE